MPEIRGGRRTTNWCSEKIIPSPIERRAAGGQKVVIYAGTFVRNGDSLHLHFHNDHKDEFWTGNAVIDQTANSITLLSSDTSLNKRLAIMGSKK